MSTPSPRPLTQAMTQAMTQGEVVAEVRRGILAGDLAPGQRLVEADLAEAYAASRGSVRAALIDLTHEGLVERIANRGARVRVVSLDEAVHITEVRMALEGLCAAKAAEHVSPAEADELLALGGRMRAAVAEADVVGYSDLNQRLHETVIRLADQPVAAELIARVRARGVRHQFRLAFRTGRPQQSLPQHLAIIDAIATHDPVAAEAAMRAHLASVLDALRETAASGG